MVAMTELFGRTACDWSYTTPARSAVVGRVCSPAAGAVSKERTSSDGACSRVKVDRPHSRRLLCVSWSDGAHYDRPVPVSVQILMTLLNCRVNETPRAFVGLWVPRHLQQATSQRSIAPILEVRLGHGAMRRSGRDRRAFKEHCVDDGENRARGGDAQRERDGRAAVNQNSLKCRRTPKRTSWATTCIHIDVLRSERRHRTSDVGKRVYAMLSPRLFEEFLNSPSGHIHLSPDCAGAPRVRFERRPISAGHGAIQ